MTSLAQPLPTAPRPPGVVRRWLGAHPWFVDITIAVCYLLGTMLMAGLQIFTDLGDQAFADPSVDVPMAAQSVTTAQAIAAVVVQLLTTTVTCAALLFRRKWPLLGLTAVAVLGVFQPDISLLAFADGIALVFLAYAVPVYGTVTRGWIAFGVLGGTELISLVWHSDGPSSLIITDWIAGMLVLLIVILVGINLGNRRRYIYALVDRADVLERDRDQLARIAVAEERERISREMHDIVAHSLSVMITLSEGSARAVERSPDKASDAMRRSAETGRNALGEMRRLLGVLHDPTGETVEFAPQPGISEVATCVEEFRQTGLDIVFETAGTPPQDRGFGLAVYRIVQESLTNALRYAGPGAKAEVRLSFAPEIAQIVVRDHGRVSTTTHMLDTVGSGNGLRGLTERVRMFGGEIRAGSHPGGGWIVEATLPTTGVPRE